MTENIRPAIAVTIEKNAAKTNRNSAIGGPAWRPNTNVIWPVDHRGIVMMHLARINFSEMPSLEGFPDSGLMQFFISTESVTLGAGEAHGNGKGFLIEYWPDPDLGISVPQPELDEDNFEDTPLVSGTPEDTMHDNGRALSFTSVQMKENVDGSERPLAWIGGFPLNVQASEANEDDIVLLQIGNGEMANSDDEHEFMWGGDIGAATFLITLEGLAGKQFDDVIYNASGY